MSPLAEDHIVSGSSRSLISYVRAKNQFPTGVNIELVTSLWPAAVILDDDPQAAAWVSGRINENPCIERDRRRLQICVTVNSNSAVDAVETERLAYFPGCEGDAPIKSAVVTADNVVRIPIAWVPSEHARRRRGARHELDVHRIKKRGVITCRRCRRAKCERVSARSRRKFKRVTGESLPRRSRSAGNNSRIQQHFVRKLSRTRATRVRVGQTVGTGRAEVDCLREIAGGRIKEV